VADVGSPEGVVLIPQRAVVKMLDRTAVWVVGPDDRVSFRNVKLGNTFGSHWIVESGLKEGERVVTAGIQHLSEGAKVSVDEPSEQDHKGESHIHSANAERR
jgi:membrane fusion protein (multidrug efflux system)